MKLSAATILLAVLGLTAICYGNSLNGAWCFDDLAIRMWIMHQLPAEAMREFGISHRPLLWFTYWLNGRQGGVDQTFIYHATNLLIHLLSVAVVFGICRKILKSNEAAAAGALIFGIHPFFTSAVDYIDGRGSELCALFVLTSCWLLIGFNSWRKWPLAVLSLIAACAVKEEAASFLVLAAAYGIVENKRWLKIGSILTAVIGLAAIVVITPYIPTVFTSNTTKPVQSLLLNGFDILTRNQQIQAVFNGFVFHNLRMWIWPNALTADPAPILGWSKFLVSAATLAALTTLVFWRKPSHGVRLGAAALLASPMLGASVMMLADPTFEYRSYICGLGIALIGGSLFLYLSRFPQAAGALLVTIVVAFGLMTTQRNEVWRTSLGVWEEAYRLAPHAVRPAQNYSADLIAVKRPDEAIRVLQSVLKDRPTLRGANANLALAYLQMGKNQEAEGYAEKGLPLFSAYMYLSIAQMGTDKRAEAEVSAQKAVDIEPRSPEAWSILAQAMARNGKNYDSYLAQARYRGLTQIEQTQRPQEN